MVARPAGGPEDNPLKEHAPEGDPFGLSLRRGCCVSLNERRFSVRESLLEVVTGRFTVNSPLVKSFCLTPNVDAVSF